MTDLIFPMYIFLAEFWLKQFLETCASGQGVHAARTALPFFGLGVTP